MALTKLRQKVKPREDAPTVEIEVDGEILRFRRPTVGDVQLSEDRRDMIARNAPGLRPDQVFLVNLLGSTYRAEGGEGQVKPHLLFAEIATENDLFFNDLCLKWEQHFPEFSNYLASRIEAKNDSGTAEESGIGSLTAPSDSGSFQES